MLFAGAGLSAWAGLPTWRKLLEETVEEVRNETLVDDGGELDRLIESGKYLELADHCREQLGPRYTELLSDRLRAADGDVPEVHRLVIGMPFAGWVTTNYDKLLERAYAEVRGGWPKTLTHADADSLGMVLFDRVPFILKAHGDIDRPDGIVLTTRDYREIIHGNPAFNATFSAILQTHAVLFVGYSLSDPDFRLLLDRQLTAFRTFVPDRYAIMPGVGEVEREVLWRTARIKVLTYEGDHAWLLEFLRTLSAAVSPVAQPEPEPVRSPTRRTGRVRGGAAAGPKPMPAATPARGRAPDRRGWNLTLAVTGSRVDANLVDAGGATVARGTGDAIGWPELAPVVGTIHDSAARVPVGSIGTSLAALLPAAVLEALSALDAADDAAEVRLTIDAGIDALPWELTTIGGSPLALRVPLVRGSAGITDSARGLPRVSARPRALLIGDPASPNVQPLPGARREVERIAALLDGRGFPVTALYGEDATAEAVLDVLNAESCDIVHFAGHAWYDALEVYLELAEGARLTAADLRPAFGKHSPALVFFNSHYTAFLPPGLDAIGGGSGAGEVALRATMSGRSGFNDVMMRSGVGAYLGCFGSPGDDGAMDLAVRVYEELLRGTSIAQAVHVARRAARARLAEDATPLLYALSGYGPLTLV